MPDLLSELAFGSFLVYSPRGVGDVSRASQRVVRLLKENVRIRATGEPAVRFLARRLREELPASVLERFLTGCGSVVPVPRSSLMRPHGLWPALELARGLVAEGIGRSVATLIDRSEPVPKSSTAPRGERPSARRHFDSFATARALHLRHPILLVDDVISRGSTFLGAGSRLAEAVGGEVRCFAAVRTLGLQPEIERILDPCVGTIRRRGDDAFRDP